jgi:hypothetical protein
MNPKPFHFTEVHNADLFPPKRQIEVGPNDQVQEMSKSEVRLLVTALREYARETVFEEDREEAEALYKKLTGETIDYDDGVPDGI